jgi:hypothetical protein
MPFLYARKKIHTPKRGSIFPPMPNPPRFKAAGPPPELPSIPRKKGGSNWSEYDRALTFWREEEKTLAEEHREQLIMSVKELFSWFRLAWKAGKKGDTDMSDEFPQEWCEAFNSRLIQMVDENPERTPMERFSRIQDHFIQTATRKMTEECSPEEEQRKDLKDQSPEEEKLHIESKETTSLPLSSEQEQDVPSRDEKAQLMCSVREQWVLLQSRMEELDKKILVWLQCGKRENVSSHSFVQKKHLISLSGLRRTLSLVTHLVSCWTPPQIQKGEASPRRKV